MKKINPIKNFTHHICNFSNKEYNSYSILQSTELYCSIDFIIGLLITISFASYNFNALIQLTMFYSKFKLLHNDIGNTF